MTVAASASLPAAPLLRGSHRREARPFWGARKLLAVHAAKHPLIAWWPEHSAPRLDRVFRALAHPARRAIIRQLSRGERNLSELASPLRMTFPAATKHVRVLERAMLVRRRVVGREHLCRLSAAPLRDAMLWTEQFRQNWEARFEALDTLLEEMKSEEGRPRRR